MGLALAILLFRTKLVEVLCLNAWAVEICKAAIALAVTGSKLLDEGKGFTVASVLSILECP
jgi:hypothetical protein